MRNIYNTNKIMEKYQGIDEVYFTFEGQELNEVFFTPHNLDRHYDRHIIQDIDGKYKMEYMTKDEYNALADELSSANASEIFDKSANIIGYVTKLGYFVKRDKSKLLTIVYADDNVKGHEVISLYKQPDYKFWARVNGDNPKYSFGAKLKDADKLINQPRDRDKQLSTENTYTNKAED